MGNKILEQAKDAVAKEYGYDNFDELLNSPQEISYQFLDKVALKYHELMNEDVRSAKYQICPKCNGQGSVSKPPYVSGDVNEWSSSSLSFICDVCKGAKIIPEYIIPPTKTNKTENYAKTEL